MWAAMPSAPSIIGKHLGPRKAWDHAGRSRHKRGYGSAWEKVRKEALKRDKGLCQVCLKDERVTPAEAVDHIQPKAKGGTDDLANLAAICRPCHIDKTMRENGRRQKPQRTIGPDGWPISGGGR